MFRPHKHTGGDYTDIRSMSTNLQYNDPLLISTIISTATGVNQYSNIAGANLILIQQALDTPNRIRTLREQYQSTLSSISTNIVELDKLYNAQYLSSQSTQTAKQTALIEYGIAQSSLSTWNSYYLISSQMYLSMLQTFTNISTEVALSIPKLLSESSMQEQQNLTSTIIFNYEVALSTSQAYIISTNNAMSINYDTNVLPVYLSTLDSLSTIYSTSVAAQQAEDLRIAQVFSSYGPLLSSISSKTGNKKVVDELISESYQDYMTATTILNSDNAMIEYLSSIQNDATTYSIYNSTITTMQEIETLYSLVMSGLSVPTQLVGAIGVQGGGAYIPNVQISSFTCNPNDTACNAKLSYLQKYITVYFSLSTALFNYENTYNAAHGARLTAERNTPFRLNSTLQDTLAKYDLDLAAAQTTIQKKQQEIAEKNPRLAELKAKYSSLTLELSTNLLTVSEYNYLLRQTGQQGGAIISTPETINISINEYKQSVINSNYSTLLSTYNAALNFDRDTRGNLEQNYYSTITSLQKVNIINNHHDDTRNNIINMIKTLEPALDANVKALSSLQYKSTLISSTIANFASNTVQSGAKIQAAIQESNRLLTPFQASTITLNDSLGRYYLNEVDSYINVISQISTYVLADTGVKQENDINLPEGLVTQSTMNKISQMFSFLSTSGNYIAALEAEQLYKSLYVYSKSIYEIQEGYMASGTSTSYLLTNNDFNTLKINYDVYVQLVNNSITARSTFNAKYLSSVSTIMPILETATQMALQTSYSLTISPIDITTTYLTNVDSNSSFGSLTCDPITGDIYIVDYNKMVLQRVSNNLSQIVDVASFTKPYICITAYNNIVYAIVWNSSMLYSVNSSQTVSQINTHVAGNNWLSNPKAISNVVNNKFYIINQTAKSIVCIDIANNYAISMAASPGGAWGGINTDNFTQLLGIAVDSNNIGYALDNDGIQIIKLNFQTNTSSVFAGGNTTGYIDGLGTSARFNATNGSKVAGITIDSQNNLFLCDIQNNAIRRIDPAGNVTTYINKELITGSKYYCGTNVPPFSVNAPLSNTGISSSLNYMNYLHGICIYDNNLYSISNARDTGIRGSDWIPNATINTHICVYPYITEPYPTTAIIFPYTMKYEYISTRKSLFSQAVEIPTTTIPTCPDSELIDGTPQPTTTLATPTTTLSPLQLGTLCRYIQITRPDNNIEVLQVIAIDKTGKNIAFGKNVNVLPTTLETAGRKQYITNGAYAPNSSSILPPFIAGTTKYLRTIGSNSALGSIASDPVTGNLYVCDLHKISVQTVSSDLTQLGTPVYFPGGVGPYISITAYNRVVYVVDWGSSKLFSVNFSVSSSPTVTEINTIVSGNNQLSSPIAISNVVNNKFYVINSNFKSIICINIANNYAISMAGSPGGTWGGINTDSFRGLLGIAIDSNNIGYALDNGSQIIKLNFQTNTSSVFAGSTSTGYADGLGTSARFNATDSNYVYGITIDSYNNLFLADITNNAIRKIDTLTAFVTTYTTLVTVSLFAVYTLGSRVLPNVITTPPDNTTISSNYLMKLYGLCIVGNTLYTVSNARDTGTTGGNWVPNATNNTSIVSYTYRPDGGVRNESSYFVSPTSTTPVTLEIDLGSTQEITAIRYIKKRTIYSPVGLTFTLLDSTRAQVGTPKQVAIDLGTTTFDLRSSSLTPVQREKAPLTIAARRDGVCGIMGRYIKLSTPSAGYYYAISQISVITTDGSNLAIGRPAIAIIGDQVYNPAKILDGTYKCLEESSSFVQTSTSTNDYIMIDLQAEYDITAVNLYYALSTSTSSSIRNAGLLQILTEDLQIAAGQSTSQYHTTIKKEILDFRRALQISNCPVSVKWAPFYGTAGIIARYIRVNKSGGISNQIAFSKLEVVDRTGIDVAQYKQVSVASGQASALNAVSNIQSTRLKAQGYLSDANNIAQYFSIDFGTAREVCCIRIYGCTDTDLMQGLTVSLYALNPTSTGATPLVTYSAVAGTQIQVFDTRYEPDTSEFSINITRSVSRYGYFGVYAESIYVYSETIPTACTIVDATGKSITPASSSGINPTIYTLPRMYEITSIILNATGVRVDLYDCYSLVVATGITRAISATDSTPVADFRNLLDGSPNKYAPIKPYVLKRGGYKLNAFNSAAGSAYSSTGVKARYVKIIPRDALTPLYISQIIAVDEFGINRAFQKLTFHMNTVGQTANLNFPPDGANAVDGVYEAQIDNPEFLTLFFSRYKRKPIGSTSYTSYVDPPGTALPIAYEFIIDLELDNTTDRSLMDLTKGAEHSINSIIYVASTDTPTILSGALSEGVIVQLLDDNLNIVAAQTVTSMVSVFGVDILDFRADTSLTMSSLPNRVEVRERIITIGPQNCGINTQYIRIEQTNPAYALQLSYVIVTDTTGYNVAMFKPTYASSRTADSYLIVDGSNYLRNAANAFTTDTGHNQYIEINLEKEYELMNLSVGDVFGSSAGFATLRARLYNKDRDIIGSYASFVPAAVKSALQFQPTGTGTMANTPLDTNNFMYLSKVGVQIADHLTAYKYQSGLLAVAAVTAYSTITTTPSLLTSPSQSGSCSTQIILRQQYTRVNGGIPTRFVRLYNVGNYIQVSQLMVYDTTGNNVAYNASTYATSTLPDCYAAYATDGYGGFFHQPRPETSCFISGNRRYDYLEVDLGAVYNIVAVRYIPPTTNLSRNIGVRVQLRGYNTATTTTVANAPIVALSEMVVKTPGETILDFRIYTPNAPSIDKVISPRITTLFNILPTNNTITGFYIKQDNIQWNPTISVDTYYYVDPSIKTMRAIYINSSGTRSYSTGSQPNYYITNSTPSNMMGVYYSSSYNRYIYTADYSANKVIQITIAQNQENNNVMMGQTYDITGVTNPYSLTGYNNMLYICENRIGGNIYSFNEAPSNQTLTPIYTNKDYMGSITINSAGELLVCVGSTKQVLRISTSGSLLSVFAAPSGTADNIIPLVYPSGIAVDTVNNVVFISDIQTNIIYAVTPSSWTILAGNGSAGYTGDGGQAAYARLDGPFFLQYNKGALYIADKNNKCIRKIDLQSGPSATISSTTTNPQAFTTTTIPGTSSTATVSTAIIKRPPTNDTYIKSINLANIIQQYQLPLSPSCLYFRENSTYAAGELYIYNNNKMSRYYASQNYNTENSLFNLLTIGNITCITCNSEGTLYLTSTNNNIYRYADIAPTIFCGNGRPGYSPDGTISTQGSIIPTAVNYNTLNQTIYFTDCQTTCGLVRIIDSSDKIQTVAGLYTANASSINPTSYYTFQFDNIRPETNPLAVILLNPCAIINDIYGNMYIADSGTHCIHRLTPTGLLQPVCGPFRVTTDPIPFLNEIATDITYNAYSVKINTPSSLTFDSEMNLYCTSLNGCQIVKISNLNALEPTVEIICGLGVNINNIGPNISTEHPAKYSSIRYPTGIAYCNSKNSLYFVTSSDATYIKRIALGYNSYVAKGNNSILPYGIVKNLGINIAAFCDFMTITQNNTIYYSDIGRKEIYSLRIGQINPTKLVHSIPGFIPFGVCKYNEQYIYIADWGNYKILRYTIHGGAIDEVYTDTSRPVSIGIHENGCMFVRHDDYIKTAYLKRTNIEVTTIITKSMYSMLGYLEVNSITNKLYLIVNPPGGTQTNRVVEHPLTFTYNPSQSTTLSYTNLSSTSLQNIIFDTAGDMYISDATTVYLIQKSSTAVTNSCAGLSNPKSMYYYGDILYVADTGNNKYVRIYTNAGFTANNDTGQPSMQSPSGIYVDSSNIYITDTGNNRVCIKNISAGTWIYISTTVSPIGIVLDANKNIYYTANSNLYKLNGITSNLICTLTNTLGQLSIDSRNTIYTKDSIGKVYKITSTGVSTFIHQITNLNAVALYENVYYYTTSNSCNSFIVNNTVTLVTPPSNSWILPNRVNLLATYGVDAYCGTIDNIIYKLSNGGVFDPICGAIASPVTNYPSTPLLTRLKSINCVSFTHMGAMIISDGTLSDGNKLIQLDVTQKLEKSFVYTVAGFPGTSGVASSSNQHVSLAYLNNPGGTCFDKDGNIFIADTGNNAVRRIDIITGNIKGVASIADVIDIQVDSNGTLYALTPTHLYRSTPINSDTYSTPTIIAGGGTLTTSGISATLSNISNARSIRLDSRGNIYICTRAINTGDNLVAAANLALYGINSTTQIIPPNPPTGGSAKANYDNLVRLWGVGEIVQGSTIQAGSLAKIQNDAYIALQASYGPKWQLGGAPIIDETTAATALVYWGTSTWKQLSYPVGFLHNITAGALFNFQKVHVETYGTMAWPSTGGIVGIYYSTPISGTQKIYNDNLSQLNTAIGTQTNNPSCKILKIDIYGIMTTYASPGNDYTAMAFDSDDNLYIVDRFSSSIYRVLAGVPNLNLNSSHKIFTFNLYSAYGIAIDKNNTIFISCNNTNNSTTYPSAHTIQYFSRPSSSTATVPSTSATIVLGNGTAAVSPYSNFYGNTLNPNIVNPKLLSIDKNNRLLFTQSGLHNVLIIPLNTSSTRINNIQSIRIEQLIPGKKVCLMTFAIGGLGLEGDNRTIPYNITSDDTITIGSISTNVTVTSSDGFIGLPYNTLTTNVNPYIMFTFSSVISFETLTLAASDIQFDAVSMNVLLFDATGALVSNRKTTPSILTAFKTVLRYASGSVSDS